MSDPATTQGKEHALERLRERRANPPERVRNEDLVAGSYMWFYCIACGHVAAVKPELYLTPPPRLCKECFALKDCGWLE